MSKHTAPILFWTPRLLSILLALFLGLFALDVFEEGYGFWKTALAFIIHLAPTTGLVLVALWVAWKREWVGALVFGVIGTAFIIQFGARWDIYAYLLIAGPMYLIGALFLLGWLFRKRERAAHS